METIVFYLRRKLKEAGAARFAAIASETGVHLSFIRKFAYNCRDNPRIQTVQPLLDFFSSIEVGERELPDPLPREAEKKAA